MKILSHARPRRLPVMLLTVLAALATLLISATSAAADAGPILHIQNEASSLCARVPGASTAWRTQLDQATCQDLPNREWRWSPLYGLDRRLVNVHSGLCLTYYGLGGDGRAVQYPCSSTNQHQIWDEMTDNSPHPWSDDYHLLVNPFSNRCLASPGDTSAAYASLVVTGCDYDDGAQYWGLFLTPVG